MTQLGFLPTLNKEHKANAWDLSFEHNSKIITVEVKNDLMAVITNNLAIEYFNPNSQKKSGLFATTADLWCHLIPNREIFIASVPRLIEWVETNPADKVFAAGGDGNADLMLYKKVRIAESGLFALDQENLENALTTLKRFI